MERIINITISGNDVIINTDKKEYRCVISISNRGYYLCHEGFGFKEIFEIVGIMDKYDFQEKVLGYKNDLGNLFPYCKTLADLLTFLDAINRYSNGHDFRKKTKHIKFNFK